MKYYIISLDDDPLFIGQGHIYLKYSKEGLSFYNDFGGTNNFWVKANHETIVSSEDKNILQKITKDIMKLSTFPLKVVNKNCKEYKEYLIRNIIE